MTSGEDQVPAMERLRIFASYAAERRCVLRSLKVALVVGTVLALINHYQTIFSGSLGVTGLVQILLTYAVPYSVATFGSASQAVQMQLAVRPRSTHPPSGGGRS